MQINVEIDVDAEYQETLERIKTKMKALNINFKELAQKTGRSYGTLLRINKGQDMTIYLAEDIMHALNLEFKLT